MSRFPVVSSGDHPCTFDIGDAPLSGSIELLDKRKSRGVAFNYPAESETTPDGGTVQSFPQISTRHSVRGHLRSGHELALVGVTIQVIFPERARLEAQWALCGTLPPDDALTFTRVEFQVGGLTELFGTTPITGTQWPEDLTVEGGRFAMTWNPKAWNTVVHDQYSLDLNFQVSARNFHPYQFAVITRPVVTIEGPALPVREWMEKYIEPFRGLAELATSRSQPINWVTVAAEYERFGKQENSRAQVFARGFTQEQYDADRSDPLAPILFTIEDEGVNADELIDGWRRLSGRYPTFTELYNSTVRDSLSARSHFLVLMPALESYHAKRFGVQERDPEVHMTQFNNIFAKAKNFGFSKDEQLWIHRYLRKRTDYALAKRIRMLVELLPDSLRERIRAKTGGRKGLNKTIEELQAARNDLAHGNDSLPDEKILPFIRLATTIARGVILVELGISPDRLNAAIDQGMWSVYELLP